jgi:hypothetical protein
VRHFFAIALVAFLLSGCVADVRRGGAQIAYKNIDHPLQETSVFSAATEDTNGLGQIVEVDGKPTSCWKFGCPSCIRVLPGTHTFTLRYSVFDNGIASYLQGESTISVEAMKAQHIYATRFGRLDNRFAISVVDEGNNSNFLISRGLKGVNLTCGPIDFL